MKKADLQKCVNNVNEKNEKNLLLNSCIFESDNKNNLKKTELLQKNVENKLLRDTLQYRNVPSEKWIIQNYKKMEDDIWWLIFGVITLLGIISRLHYITMPFNVVWDETHFGKMASWYLNRTFFFDVHPPGGKLLIALFGYLADYNGTYQFKHPGESYEGYQEIIYMRLGCALFGAGMAPISFLTVWELTSSLLAASFSGLLCIYEIGLITLSKFILLDPLLIFFVLSSFHAMTCFHRQNSVRPFSLKWWTALLYLGFSLGCTMSIKFVGVFIVLVVGLYVASNLWTIFSDISYSLMEVFGHFLARALCLICLPFALYVLIFYIHDQVLIYSHHTDMWKDDLGIAAFSSEFQKRLINSSLYEIKQPAEASYGSIVTLRNDEIGGGYLHSHNFTYPEKLVNAKLQQVTTLKVKDSNNNFRVLFPMDDPDMEDEHYFGEPESVLHDNWIRLHHVNTQATVACHKNKSLVATKLNLVYGRRYNLTLPTQITPEDDMKNSSGSSTKQFLDDLWNVKIANGGVDQPVQTLRTRFQLISPRFKCALAWSKERLSHVWGFQQGEAACTKNLQDPYTFWRIETVVNPHADNSSFDNVTIGFWERFLESHRVMAFMNARLKPVENGGNLDSPWMWPILFKSAPWYDVNYRIVLLGNPLLFLLNLVSLVATPIILMSSFYRRCRNPQIQNRVENDEEKFLFSLRWLYIAYLFHYIPFYTMQRILYFHHYFPSQAFACMITAILMSKMFIKFSALFASRSVFVLRLCVLSAVFLLTLSFLLYCYVGYGHPTSGPFALHNSTFKRIRFNDDWLI